MSDAAPGVREVAEALDADGEQLRRFVENHPDPTAANVLGAFEGDPDDEELVASWLEGRTSVAERNEQRRERRRKRRRDRRGRGGGSR
jgi:hypothetical protein